MFKRQAAPVLVCALLFLAAGAPHQLFPSFSKQGTPQLSLADGCFYSAVGDTYSRLDALTCFTPAEVDLLQRGSITADMTKKARQAVRPGRIGLSWAGWHGDMASL